MNTDFEQELKAMGCTPLTRSYSLSARHDEANLRQGICPDYALNWSLRSNKVYWPADHDFLTPPNNYKASKPHFSILRKIQMHIRDKNINPIVFCDLDGVLVDFESGVEKLTGKHPDDQDAKNLWIRINRASNFFETLEWLPEGRRLWEYMRLLDIEPIILTGSTSEKISNQKIKWCQDHLGSQVQVICCRTKDKPLYCIQGSILIDDRDKVKAGWEDNGGKFFLFSSSKVDEITGQLALAKAEESSL
jgi:hypothetical protein